MAQRPLPELRAAVKRMQRTLIRKAEAGEPTVFARKLLEGAQRELFLRTGGSRRAREQAQGHQQAQRWAELYVEEVRRAGGPRAVRVWSKPGVGVRVYFPGDLGYLGVGRGGELERTSRGYETFAAHALYPSWRRALGNAEIAYKTRRGRLWARERRKQDRRWARAQQRPWER